MYKSGGNAIRMYRPLSRGLFFFFFFLKRVGHGNRTRISPPPLLPSSRFSLSLPLLPFRFVPFFLQRVSHQRDARRVLIMPRDRSPLSWPFHGTPARAGATYYVPASFRFVPLSGSIVLVLSPYSTLLNVVALKCGGSSSRCQFFPRTSLARTEVRFPPSQLGRKIRKFTSSAIMCWL